MSREYVDFLALNRHILPNQQDSALHNAELTGFDDLRNFFG